MAKLQKLIRFKIPLNFEHFSHFANILLGTSFDSNFKKKLNAASKFYMQALQTVEHEPEIAYLHLITAGEILSSFYNYKKEEILDEQIISILKDIENNLYNGIKSARLISNRLLGVKKIFVKSLCSFMDGNFFESISPENTLDNFNIDNIEKSISAAYDLRSKYVHTGVPFGKWIYPSAHHSDLQFGRPVVSDSDFSKILEKAPTFLGLERFIRYCILNFIASNGCPEMLEIRNNT